jgi:hypothetical protein
LSQRDLDLGSVTGHSDNLGLQGVGVFVGDGDALAG